MNENTNEITVDMESFDFNSLTLGEAEIIEDILGISLAKAAEGSQVKMMRAIIYVMLRRDDPEITYEATADIPMAGLTGGLQLDPTTAP